MNPIYFMAIGMWLLCIPIVCLFRLVMRIEEHLWDIENFINYHTAIPAEEAEHGEEE